MWPVYTGLHSADPPENGGSFMVRSGIPGLTGTVLSKVSETPASPARFFAFSGQQVSAGYFQSRRISNPLTAARQYPTQCCCGPVLPATEFQVPLPR